jgi:hypothetical protein
VDRGASSTFATEELELNYKGEDQKSQPSLSNVASKVPGPEKITRFGRK